MDQLSCPHCGGQVVNDRRLANQVVSCPSCRNPFRMPPAAEAGPFVAEQPPAPAPPPPAPPPPTSTPAASPKAEAKREPKPAAKAHVSSEPWYYLFLEGYARLVLGLGIGLAGLGLFASVLSFVIMIFESDSLLNMLLFFGLLLVQVAVLAFFLLGISYVVALVLLLVDAARNLRELRRNMGKK